MKDEEIVSLYWERKEEAISETANKYSAYLSKIAYHILFDYEDAQECVNDTYLKAWNSMPVHRPQVLSSYLGRITRQLSIDLFRRKNSAKRRPSQYMISLTELEDCIASGPDPEQQLDADLLDEAMNRFLRELPEETRTVFVGRYFFFDPLKEVAAYCGITEGKTKSILFRTRKKLKEFLEKEGFTV